MSEAVVTFLVVLVLLVSDRIGRRRTDAALVVLALAAGVVHTDYFDFHGDGSFVHYHDAGHHYLGSKYFSELGYTGLYGALLVAEMESEGDISSVLARDLVSGELTTAEAVLAQGEQFRRGFSPPRWLEFRHDATRFRQALGPLFSDFVTDHGFEPTPLWALGAGRLAEQLSIDSSGGMLTVALLDGVLMAGVVLALGLVFGRRTALLSLIFLVTAFGGGNFDWIGGAYLRYAWLASLMLGVAALGRGWHFTAGILVALSTGLRLFPGIFVLAAVADVVLALVHGRRPRRAWLRFLAGFVVTLPALFAVTLASEAHGWQAWQGFAVNMRLYLETMPYNVMGVQQVTATLATLLPASLSTPAASLLGGLAGLLCLSAALWLGRRQDDVGAISMGCLALFGLLELEIYYSLVLVLLIIANRHRPKALATLFGVEALVWGAATILGLGQAMHVVHSLLLLFLFGALYADELLDAEDWLPISYPPKRAIRDT